MGAALPGLRLKVYHITCCTDIERDLLQTKFIQWIASFSRLLAFSSSERRQSFLKTKLPGFLTDDGDQTSPIFFGVRLPSHPTQAYYYLLWQRISWSLFIHEEPRAPSPNTELSRRRLCTGLKERKKNCCPMNCLILGHVFKKNAWLSTSSLFNSLTYSPRVIISHGCFRTTIK